MELTPEQYYLTGVWSERCKLCFGQCRTTWKW